MAKRKSSPAETTADDIFFGHGAAYSAKRDGPLEQYFETHDGSSACSLFQGYDQFEMLKKEGWLGPRLTIIRLMCNVGRGDEHFEITDDFQLLGLEANAHSGREGVHDPKKVLEEGPCFEVHRPLFLHLRKRHEQFLKEMRELEAQVKKVETK